MNNKRVELSFWNRTLHHWPTILFLIIGLLMFHASTIHPPKPTPATMSPRSLIIAGLILCGLAIVTFIWLESKLIFDKIEIGFDHPTAIKIILATADKNRWFVDNDIPPDSKRLELTKLNPWGGTPNEVCALLPGKILRDEFLFQRRMSVRDLAPATRSQKISDETHIDRTLSDHLRMGV